MNAHHKLPLMLVVDPGVPSGWAIFGKYDKSLKESGVVRPLKGTVWPYSVEHVAYELSRIAEHVDVVYCEKPRFFESSERGRAAMRSDSIVRLSHFCGYLHASVCKMGAGFQYVEVSEWKGQMNDKMVKMALYKRLGKKFRHHEMDAAAIGLHVLGLWIPN